MRLSENDIRKVQMQLKRKGFDPGPIDGLRGPRTDNAITQFKITQGLKARPFIGPITWKALMDDSISQAASRVHASPDMPWYDEAERMMGLHEVRNKATLRGWFVKSVAWIDPADIPWCGAFVESCIAKTMPKEPRIANPLGARNWAKWGRPCAPQRGAVLVFWRGSKSGWSGHVGFYQAEDTTAYHVLGGNQSNAVTITRVAKNRLLGARWPVTAMSPVGSAVLTAGGGKLSTNEA